jgi:hypothetical protein
VPCAQQFGGVPTGLSAGHSPPAGSQQAPYLLGLSSLISPASHCAFEQSNGLGVLLSP